MRRDHASSFLVGESQDHDARQGPATTVAAAPKLAAARWGRPILGVGRPLYWRWPPEFGQRAALCGGWAALVAAGRPTDQIGPDRPVTRPRFLRRSAQTRGLPRIIRLRAAGRLHHMKPQCPSPLAVPTPVQPQVAGDAPGVDRYVCICNGVEI